MRRFLDWIWPAKPQQNEPPSIKLTTSEVQSGLSRQRWAELLIEQLPSPHDGRTSWLLNYGVGDEAQRLRAKRGLDLDPEFGAVRPR